MLNLAPTKLYNDSHICFSTNYEKMDRYQMAELITKVTVNAFGKTPNDIMEELLKHEDDIKAKEVIVNSVAAV